MALIDGKRVMLVAERRWREADDIADLEHAYVVGRADVAVEGGGLFEGLVLTKLDGTSVIVVWERSTRAFRALRLTDFTPAPQA
jgi:hypothetical protein